MDKESRFLRACRRESVDCTPVWFMRQAGRYMEEYRALRKKYTLLELCHAPELAAEVTMQPINRFDLDAAIIFADILLPLPGLGLEFEFAVGEGPRIHKPVRSAADVERLRVFEPREELGFVLEALGIVRGQLPKSVALIGFAGAPFTLASYMIEGGYSRHFVLTKQLMYSEPQAWHLLMDKIATVTGEYLRAQVEAGAQVVQLFDSWIGALGADDYRDYVLPHSKKIFDSLSDLDIPKIHFGTGTSGYLELMRQAGGTVQSVDWRMPLDQAWEKIGFDSAIQGNLDPIAVLCDQDTLKRKVFEILENAGGRPGHIFNLGHGFLPQTPVENVEAMIEWIHGYKAS
ncbi:MAG: uroporphyrinogen decarboxylase [Acidobacteriota bacterium]|nr:MAG: uroporphyrinogen decarboxylase [Acidobacteriota bacterium]